MAADGARNIRRYLLWLVLSLPAILITWRFADSAMPYGEVLHVTGELSIRLMIVALAATPLRLAFPRAGWTLKFLGWRRALGVASFGYAMLHLGVYLLEKSDIALIIEEGVEPGLLTGWLAALIFLLLAVTSNDVSVRTMGRAWKALHRWVYLAAALGVAHWVLTSDEPVGAIVHGGIIVALETIRIVLALRRRRSRA